MSTRYTSTGAERAALRGRLHGESPVVQVGREGLSDGVVASVGEALAAREVIKVRFGKGDLVTFPQGMECTWHVIKPIRKHYNFG